MNIELEGYEREQLIAALFSSARKVRYEFTISNAAEEHLGLIEVQNAKVSFDSTSEVMRTFTGEVKKSDLLNLESIDYRIVPWMCLTMPNGKEAKWPLGKFMIVPSMNSSNNINMINFVGYDLAKIALDDKGESRIFVSNNDIYTSAIGYLIATIYTRFDITESDSTKSYPQEWELGESKLKIVNDLLKGINYNPLHFDENGVAICKPYIDTSERQIDFQYMADKTSIIIDGLSLASDKYDIPNKWIRYTENPEAPYYMSVFVNDSPNSPYSTVNRHRFIVDSQAVEDISDQVTLDSYTARIANESMQGTEKIEFSTLNMPGHGFQECLFVEIPEYEITGKYIEKAWEMELKTGGTMTHVCEKVVRL